MERRGGLWFGWSGRLDENPSEVPRSVEAGRVRSTTLDLSPAEQRYVEKSQAWQKTEGAYSMIQGTKPQTLAYGLADSPAGQCAWIVEKFAAWADSGGDPERAFDRDELLDNVSLYWLTNTAASSARVYWETGLEAPPAEWAVAGVPSAVSVFPADITRPSERWVAAADPGLVYYRALERGGHFTAMEVPDLFVAEVRAAFRAIAAAR